MIENTAFELEKNKEEFIEIAKTITIDRPLAQIDSLINYLEDIKFFVAPASSQYNLNFEGGLCLHALNTYHLLNFLSSKLQIELNPSSIVIVSLFSEIEKAKWYEVYVKNEKVYSENGSKKDNLGNFEWISSKAYKYSDNRDDIYGAIGINSYMILKDYIPNLTNEEIGAIINRSLGMETGNINKNYSIILNNNKLLTLLHCASLIGTHIIENEKI